jgi:hypothetical protein
MSSSILSDLLITKTRTRPHPGHATVPIQPEPLVDDPASDEPFDPNEYYGDNPRQMISKKKSNSDDMSFTAITISHTAEDDVKMNKIKKWANRVYHFEDELGHARNNRYLLEHIEQPRPPRYPTEPWEHHLRVKYHQVAEMQRRCNEWRRKVIRQLLSPRGRITLDYFNDNHHYHHHHHHRRRKHQGQEEDQDEDEDPDAYISENYAKGRIPFPEMSDDEDY